MQLFDLPHFHSPSVFIERTKHPNLGVLMYYEDTEIL